MGTAIPSNCIKGYKLIKEEIEEGITDLMLTKQTVSRYVTITNTGHADQNWLANRINPNRGTLATEDEVNILAKLLQTDPNTISIAQLKEPEDQESEDQEPTEVELRLNPIIVELRAIKILLIRIAQALEGGNNE